MFQFIFDAYCSLAAIENLQDLPEHAYFLTIVLHPAYINSHYFDRTLDVSSTYDVASIPSSIRDFTFPMVIKVTPTTSFLGKEQIQMHPLSHLEPPSIEIQNQQGNNRPRLFMKEIDEIS